MPYAHRDVDIYFTSRGDGDETVFFCHGAGGNSTSWWQQMGAFASRYRCLAHDHRGFGRSRCSAEQFAVHEFVDDALAVLDAAAVTRAHLVCQSMGGWTGVRLALEHPDRVRSLVLSDTIGGLALASGIDSIRDMGERAARAGALSPALAADYHLRDPAGAFLYTELSAFNADLERLGLFRRMFAAEAMIDLSRATSLSIPILVVAGRHDLIWPPEVLRELAGHLPNAQFVEVEAGHSPYFENPVAFNAALAAFLESI
ncbi:MAG: alpha/beta hydrolase [Pseudomonadales bacterium]